MLGGYDIFKEAKIRRFWSKFPGSTRRASLVRRLYPYLPNFQRQPTAYLQAFFHTTPEDLASPWFSHLPRWRLTSRLKLFLSAEMRAAVADYDGLGDLAASLPPEYHDWPAFAQTQYLETAHLLPGYLLSSQGDRMAMAHGVEARVPYLDHRIFEFAAALPDRSKLRGLQEKAILRRWAATVLPAGAAQRTKQPYRAPDVPAFFGRGEGEPPAYVAELLDESALKRAGIFDPAAARGLVRRCRTGQATGVREGQALVAILSTQLWQREFLETPVESGAMRYESGRFVLAN
jgi:asparagine synthase (glutamine-hydrolysing)